jgi:hypothetical protein
VRSEREPRGLRAGLSSLAARDPLDLSLLLCLLDLVLRPVGSAVLRPLALVAAVVGLVVPGAARGSWLWLGLAALTGARVVLDWPFADNHGYLLAYWCLAAGLALRSAEPREFLAANARWLIGLAFAFATLWKLALSPDFVDGTFLRVALVVDPRFEWITRLAGGVSPEELAALRETLLEHVDVAAIGGGGVELPQRLEWIAAGATAVTLLLEGAIAAAFLWPRAGALSRLRDPLLLAFCAATYALAPVPGFGWLLLALGAAQSPPDRRALRLLYAGVFLLLILYGALPGRRSQSDPALDMTTVIPAAPG